ncbi:hypothetical protein [Pimelobacter simplex]|uniref:hypothetical protein n=1 Tax=Nocardioides simplex TaxID=2045 RepID=UPI00193327CE|nr:hypothetical protein [Pimelobacter simplex]
MDQAPGNELSLEQLATRKWLEIVPLIDRLVERAETRGEWPVLPRTALAGDNAATAPFQTTHAVMQLLNAGIDNLNGVRHLVFGRPGTEPLSAVLHQSAHFVLARGAIENLATAIWLIGPRSRADRVERVLRWHAKNVHDQHAATDPLGLTGGRTKAEKYAQLEELMLKATGQPRPLGKGYRMTDVLADVDRRTGDDQHLSTLFIWQLCSGFAHARPWASLGLLEREILETDDPDILHVRMTSDLARALMAPNRAMELCQFLLKRWNALNAPL